MKSRMRWQWVALTVWFLVNILLAGLLTNWFRYGPSLEVMVVLAVQVGSTLAVAVGALVAAWLRPSAAVVTMAIVVALSAVALLATMNSALGVYWPQWRWNDVERSEPESLRLNDGRLVEYYVELRNPFSAHPAIILVLSDGAKKHRIRLPWTEEIDGFASPTPEDPWVHVSVAGENRELLLARIAIVPGTPRTYVVDLNAETAVASPIP